VIRDQKSPGTRESPFKLSVTREIGVNRKLVSICRDFKLLSEPGYGIFLPGKVGMDPPPPVPPPHAYLKACHWSHHVLPLRGRTIYGVVLVSTAKPSVTEVIHASTMLIPGTVLDILYNASPSGGYSLYQYHSSTLIQFDSNCGDLHMRNISLGFHLGFTPFATLTDIQLRFEIRCYKYYTHF
jgi:hypothetical protein